VRTLKFFFLITFIFCLQQNLAAQVRCVTDEYRDHLQQKNKQVSSQRFEKWLSSKRPVTRLRTQRTTAEPILIPVVVHVIHNGEDLGTGVNIPESQIISQMEVLNEDFKRLNTDTINTPDEFKPLAGFMNVEFVLAKRDPNGYPTNGIIRKKGSKTSWNPLNSDNDLLKAESYWPAEDYLNIWVCNLSGENLGYAQFPDIDLPGLENEDKDNRLTDGVVIDYVTFGSSNKGDYNDLRVPYDLGRTTSHEVGHWLGLLHIFGDEGGCLVDDNVDDTPLQNSSYNGECPSHPVSSCNSVDMFQNYMDYTADACMNIFTMGQVARMQIVLDNAVRRASLKNGLGAFPPDIDYADLTLRQINSPKLVSCSGNIQPKVTLQNSGTIPITKIRAEYGISDGEIIIDTLQIDSLKSGQQLLLALGSLDVPDGSYTFESRFDIVDEVDLFPNDNSQSSPFIVNNDRIEAPFVERFDEDNLWSVFSTDMTTTWEFIAVDNNRSAYINLFNYPNQGVKDYLISPVIDFSATLTGTLKLKLSYAYNEGFEDSLAILASDDCGETFSVIYNEPGDIFKIKNSNKFWEPSVDSDWRTLTFDLTPFAGSPDVRLAFVTTNGFGNNLYLDDLEFFIQSEDDIVDVPVNNVVIFPNPTVNSKFKIGVSAYSKQDVYLSVVNAQGQDVYDQHIPGALNQVFTVDLAGKAPGVYIVKVRGESINSTSKVILRP